MATSTLHTPPVSQVPHTPRLIYRLAREVPVIPLLILLSMALAAIFAPVLAPYGKLDPVPVTAEQCQAKYSRSFPNCYIDDDPPFFMKESLLRTPLGTDYLGRDVLSRLMYGARISLVVSLTGTLAAGAIGTFLGLVSGYLGGVWDQVIMRITDAWLTLPILVFAILLSSIRRPGVENVIFILGGCSGAAMRAWCGGKCCRFGSGTSCGWRR